MLPRPKIVVKSTDSLSEAFAAIRIPADYLLAPGATYELDPNWSTVDYRAVVPAGTVIEMNGSRLVLRADAASMVTRPDARDLWALTVGADVRLVDGIIDANEQAFRNADPKKQWSALGLWAPDGRLTTENVWIEHVRGLQPTSMATTGLTVGAVEGFALLLNGETGGCQITGGGVRGCPANSYVSAVNAGITGNPEESLIEDFEIDVESGNWMAFGVNRKIRIRGAKVRGGVKRVIHNDTGVTDEVVVEGSTFEGAPYLVSMVSPAGQHRKTRIEVRHSKVTFPAGTAWLAELWDRSAAGPIPPAVTGNVLFLDLDVAPRSEDTWISVAGRSLLPVTIVDSTLPARIRSTAGNMLAVHNIGDTEVAPAEWELDDYEPGV